MITDLQREERRKFIGSADAAAIAGLDPWRSAWDVYNEKVYGTVDRTTEAMATGNRLERAVLDWFASEETRPLLRDHLRIGRDGLRAANHDALIEDSREGVEAKTSRILTWMYPTVEEPEWGEDGSEDVPDHVYVQCQHQMYVSDLAVVHVPVLIGGRGWMKFRVRRDEKTIKTLGEKCEAFWCNHVQRKDPPSRTIPSLEIARRIRREPGKKIEIPSVDPVLAWENAKLALKLAEQAKENAEAVLLSLLGDAEAAETPMGLLKYLPENAGKRINLERLKAERPDVFDQYAEPTTRRCLRLKAPKGLPAAPEQKQLVSA